MSGKFIFLGTGSSFGVPVVGCNCKTCKSPHPGNKRLRTSGLLKVKGKVFLIDPGPDFRTQALIQGIDHLDGVLITHTHYDHIGGLDELRIFSYKRTERLPCLLSKESFEDLRKRYYYLFKEASHGDSSIALLDFIVLEGQEGVAEFLGVPIAYFSYKQGSMKVTGFKIGNFAYVTDIKDYPSSIFHVLKGVKYLVVSGLRQESTKIHFSIAEASYFGKEVGAQKTYITHIAHEVEHESQSLQLMSHVELGLDNLEVNFDM